MKLVRLLILLLLNSCLLAMDQHPAGGSAAASSAAPAQRLPAVVHPDGAIGVRWVTEAEFYVEAVQFAGYRWIFVCGTDWRVYVPIAAASADNQPERPPLELAIGGGGTFLYTGLCRVGGNQIFSLRIDVPSKCVCYRHLNDGAVQEQIPDVSVQAFTVTRLQSAPDQRSVIDFLRVGDQRAVMFQMPEGTACAYLSERYHDCPQVSFVEQTKPQFDSASLYWVYVYRVQNGDEDFLLRVFPTGCQLNRPVVAGPARAAASPENSAAANEAACSICYGSLERNVTTLACSHRFHDACLCAHVCTCLQRHVPCCCPLCRRPIDLNIPVIQATINPTPNQLPSICGHCKEPLDDQASAQPHRLHCCLNCGHYLHAFCAFMCKHFGNRCPLCNQQIDPAIPVEARARLDEADERALFNQLGINYDDFVLQLAQGRENARRANEESRRKFKIAAPVVLGLMVALNALDMAYGRQGPYALMGSCFFNVANIMCSSMLHGRGVYMPWGDVGQPEAGVAQNLAVAWNVIAHALPLSVRFWQMRQWGRAHPGSEPVIAHMATAMSVGALSGAMSGFCGHALRAGDSLYPNIWSRIGVWGLPALNVLGHLYFAHKQSVASANA